MSHRPKTSGGAQSLRHYCERVLIRYINSLDDIGSYHSCFSYATIAPVLRKLTSPVQLRRIESRAPEIRAETRELWEKLIVRDFGSAAVGKYIPHDDVSWSSVYDRHHRDAGKASKQAAEALKAKFDSLKKGKDEVQTRLVSSSAVPPVKRKRWGSGTVGWDVKAGSKTKNIVQKARREAKEMSFFHGNKSRLAVPMHQLRGGMVGKDLREKISKREDLKRKRPGADGEDANTMARKRKPVVVGPDEDEDEEVMDDGLKEASRKWAGGVAEAAARPVVKVRRAPANPFMMPKKR